MPNLETVNELADQLADWLGVYGACSSDGDSGCQFDAKGLFCCRQGFLQEMSQRITNATANDEFLARRPSHGQEASE